MLMMIPGKRRYAITRGYAEMSQRDCEALGAIRHVAVGIAMQRSVGQATYDFRAAEVCLGSSQNNRQRQLEIHHQAIHRLLPPRLIPLKVTTTVRQNRPGFESARYSTSAQAFLDSVFYVHL
jgi:hypothetical protein